MEEERTGWAWAGQARTAQRSDERNDAARRCAQTDDGDTNRHTTADDSTKVSTRRANTTQAEAKSAPVNPMKELRIEKLVISAFGPRRGARKTQI